MNVLSTDFPSPRSGACMVYINGFLYIYGGKNSGGLMNELWKFDLKTKTYVLESQSADAFETNFCYLIGGKKILGSILLPEPSDEFVAFDLFQIYTENICSRGTVYDGASCVSCK